jgi:hypothetical protein
MESRTSFGKKGSVQHVSEYRGVAFHPCQVWGYTPFALVWLCYASIPVGVSFQPWESAALDGQISLHLSLLFFCPGCPA